MLDDCPQGTKLVNQPGGAYTSDPAQVDHASQRCQACQDFEYIVNPKGGMCLPCPVGAICVGGSRFEGRDNSRWAISPSNPNQYDLVGCPEGFKMIVSPPEEQQCQACNTGEYILDPNDPNAVCQLCPSAAANQCRGGRPPIFQLKEVKVSFGINGDCVEADTGTMQGVLSGLLDIHRDDMAITEQCAAQSARRAMQSVNVTLSLSEEKANEVLVTMKDQVVFEAALKEAVAATGLDVTLQELPTVSIAVNSRPASEVWTLEGNEFKLKQCPNGTLLVNTTVDLQNCKQCAVDSYTLSDKDGCQEIESLTAGTKSWLCLNRDCHPCPSGDNGERSALSLLFSALQLTCTECAFHCRVRLAACVQGQTGTPAPTSVRHASSSELRAAQQGTPSSESRRRWQLTSAYPGEASLSLSSAFLRASVNARWARISLTRFIATCAVQPTRNLHARAGAVSSPEPGPGSADQQPDPHMPAVPAGGGLRARCVDPAGGARLLAGPRHDVPGQR
eukprot:2824614-Rhodomonas_salina.2